MHASGSASWGATGRASRRSSRSPPASSSPMPASASCSLAPRCDTCRRNPTSPASRRCATMSWPASPRATRPIRSTCCWKASASPARRARPGCPAARRARAALVRTLAPEPDILMLDEPTNHLDLPAIEWLEETLGQTRSALVLISHDRRFLDKLSEATLWIDRGRSRRLEEGFGAFEAWRDDVLAQEELEAHKLTQEIRREEHWVRYGVHRAPQAQRAADARARRSQGQAPRDAPARAEDARPVGGTGLRSFRQERHPGPQGLQVLWRPADRLRPHHRDRARRPVGHRRAERCRQDDLAQPPVRPAGARQRHREARHQSRHHPPRPAPRRPPAGTTRSPMSSPTGAATPSWSATRPATSSAISRTSSSRPTKPASPSRRCRAASAGGSSWPARWPGAPTSSSSTSRPTISTWRRSTCCKRCWPTIRARSSSSAHDRDFLDRVVTTTLMHEGEGVWKEYAGGYSDMIAQRGEGTTVRRAHASFKPKGAIKGQAASSAEARGGTCQARLQGNA